MYVPSNLPLKYCVNIVRQFIIIQVYFQDGEKNLVLTPNADIWSASITMMYGFQGRVDKDDVALKMVKL